MVRWGRVDGVRGVTKQVLQQIFAAVLYTRALTKKQGLELAKINILAVALALLRERRSYGLLSDLSTESLISRCGSLSETRKLFACSSALALTHR